MDVGLIYASLCPLREFLHAVSSDAQKHPLEKDVLGISPSCPHSVCLFLSFLIPLSFSFFLGDDKVGLRKQQII